jgi:hypothetical protein
MRRLPKWILLALAMLVGLELGIAARPWMTLAQLNPAPVVIPGSSGAPAAPGTTSLAPLSVPVTAPTAAPVVPGAPAAIATTAALPVLNPAPAIVAGNPPIALQSVFRCSCFATGLGVQWIGQVQAASYPAANRAALGQCASYVAATSGPSSPYIPQASGFSFGRTVFPNENPNLAPGNVVTVPRSPVNTEATGASIIAAQTGYCARCACN